MIKTVLIATILLTAMHVIPAAAESDVSAFRTPYKLDRFVLTRSDDPNSFDSIYITCPFVFSANGRFQMTYVGFDGTGYQTGMAESDDLINWRKTGLIIARDPNAQSVYGRIGIGLTSILRDNDLASTASLKKVNGRYVGSYLSFPKKGREAGAGIIGLAWSDDLRHWEIGDPILRPEEGAAWEKGGLYKSYLLEENGTYYLFYNAKDITNGPWIEQTGLATSKDLITWTRHPGNPVLPVGPKGSMDEKFASDPVVMKAGDRWAMYYFGLGGGHARDLLALSPDLVHFTKVDEVMVDTGAPGAIDERHAHKPSVISWRGDLYHFYDGVSAQWKPTRDVAPRGIGIARSRPW